MIKILSAEQIKALDKFTIEHEPIASIDLMERASRSFVTWFTERYNTLKKVCVVCGTGNNGGDGLAITRMLKDWGYPVKVYVLKESASQKSLDFQQNLQRLSEIGIEVHEITSVGEQLFADRDIVIDAIFGYGLSRPVEGIYAKVIDQINRSNATVISVDMPSGLMADKASTGWIVQADFTLSFQFPKLTFFFPDCHKYTGEWIVLDIGLHKEYVKQLPATNYFVSQKAVKRIIKKRNKFDHKGTFGHALLVAGSYGKIGAAVLSAKAILRSGAGLLSVFTPKCGYSILQSSVPEAMVITDPADDNLSEAPDTGRYNVVGIGPGIGQSSSTVKMLTKLLEGTSTAMVIDADALNILATNRELLHLIPAGSILTPHPKEFERLVGVWSNDFERLEKQNKLASQLRSVIVLKGAYTSIVSPTGEVFFNSTGNPGMATGGSGDVLTGILTGILAQGYSPENAAILGVYLHGLAGDLAALETGLESLIPSDIISFLPPSFRQLKR